MITPSTLRIATLLLATVLLPQGCATIRPTNLENVCEIFRDRPDWYRATADTERKWSLPIQIQMAIIYHESTFRADARPSHVNLLGVPLWRKSSIRNLPAFNSFT